MAANLSRYFKKYSQGLEGRSQKAPADLLRDCLATFTGQLAVNGYMLASQSEVAVTYHRKYRHWGVILLAIVFFPIGLLALLITDDATITATVEPDEDSGGSVLILTGTGPKNVRSAFENLRL
ncbi:MAG TPA: hypothetical protein VJQ84_04325 [Solirubrobacterales bacterium]|nr:hypothetical protein [Solirubrobacterales bacterium]